MKDQASMIKKTWKKASKIITGRFSIRRLRRKEGTNGTRSPHYKDIHIVDKGHHQSNKENKEVAYDLCWSYWKSSWHFDC